MSTGSPTAYLLWSILSCLFQCFLIYHLWSYDRFQCVRWNSGRQPGAFKRVMTYTYLATLPLLVLFSVAITVCKYREGFLYTESGFIVPRPVSDYSATNKRWMLPLFVLLSVAWSFEVITHLEELTFWLFLLHQGPKPREWFGSWEFKLWSMGSVVALLGLPMTAVVSHRDLDTCEAWIFLVGSSASTGTTIPFLYVLARFAPFIRRVKQDGAEPYVIVRLVSFYQLNMARVAFRFLFTLPLFVIALDGVQGTGGVNRDPFWSDFLLMTGGVGCFVSSAITLLIFFPRALTQELGYQVVPVADATKVIAVEPQDVQSPSRLQALHRRSSSLRPNSFTIATSPRHSTADKIYPMSPVRLSEESHEGMVEYELDDSTSQPTGMQDDYGGQDVPHPDLRYADQYPRRSYQGSHRDSSSRLHPYVRTFTSPIDLLDSDAADEDATSAI